MALQQIQTRHVGHLLVREDQIEGLLTKKLQGLFTVSGRGHFKALLFEKTRDQLALGQFVVDYEDMKTFGHLNLLTVDGQDNLEAAPLARFAENSDRSAVSLYNPACDRQPQPGALGLGREVRLEDSRAVFRRNPDSGVGNAD